MAEKDLKRKFALWIRPSLLEEVDSLYESDNCASRSEFMEKALRFYMGYLSSQKNQDYLAHVIPTDEQAQYFLNALSEEHVLYHAFYVLAIYTGCRRGELCALRWSDFSFVDHYTWNLVVSRSRSVVPGKGVVEGPTKNDRSRSMTISYYVVSTLWHLYSFQKRMARENHRKVSSYLFANAEGNPVHPDTFNKRLRKIFRELGFPSSFHLHTLRQYFVSTMLHEGVDKQTVAELAGHGDTSFLERTYCHPQMKLKQEAAEKLEEALFRF